MNAHDLTRREMLRWCGAVGGFCLFGGTLTAEAESVPATRAVDHLLLGVADLDHGIEWVEKLTGVKAVFGGSHPGRGTRNALLSLGGRRYLEIIAPDPEQTAYNFQIDIRKLAEPRLITWAAAASDINAIAKKARDAGYQLFGPNDGSRARPDGKVLKWKTLGIQNALGHDGVEPIPFFIEWAADSLHPSQDSPQGCELQSLAMEHPDAAKVRSALKDLGIELKVKQASGARLTATLKTPKGKVELS
ncbi:MAG TPA: VOC family protein [Thermoanaerobaculia bacterium]